MDYDHSRPRLRVRDEVTWVSIDEPVELLEGAPITGDDWPKLVRYIRLNRNLLVDLWEGKISEADYAAKQKPI